MRNPRRSQWSQETGGLAEGQGTSSKPVRGGVWRFFHSFVPSYQASKFGFVPQGAREGWLLMEDFSFLPGPSKSPMWLREPKAKKCNLLGGGSKPKENKTDKKT